MSSSINNSFTQLPANSGPSPVPPMGADTFAPGSVPPSPPVSGSPIPDLGNENTSYFPAPVIGGGPLDVGNIDPFGSIPPGLSYNNRFNGSSGYGDAMSGPDFIGGGSSFVDGGNAWNSDYEKAFSKAFKKAGVSSQLTSAALLGLASMGSTEAELDEMLRKMQTREGKSITKEIALELAQESSNYSSIGSNDSYGPADSLGGDYADETATGDEFGLNGSEEAPAAPGTSDASPSETPMPIGSLSDGTQIMDDFTLVLPDGSIQQPTDVTEEGGAVYPDGTTISMDGVVSFPDGTTEQVQPADSSTPEGADGGAGALPDGQQPEGADGGSGAMPLVLGGLGAAGLTGLAWKKGWGPFKNRGNSGDVVKPLPKPDPVDGGGAPEVPKTEPKPGTSKVTRWKAPEGYEFAKATEAQQNAATRSMLKSYADQAQDAQKAYGSVYDDIKTRSAAANETFANTVKEVKNNPLLSDIERQTQIKQAQLLRDGKLSSLQNELAQAKEVRTSTLKALREASTTDRALIEARAPSAGLKHQFSREIAEHVRTGDPRLSEVLRDRARTAGVTTQDGIVRNGPKVVQDAIVDRAKSFRSQYVSKGGHEIRFNGQRFGRLSPTIQKQILNEARATGFGISKIGKVAHNPLVDGFKNLGRVATKVR